MALEALRILGVEVDSPNIGIIQLGEQRDDHRRAADRFAQELANARVRIAELERAVDDALRQVNELIGEIPPR